MRYWWVNHKQTFRHEFMNGYVWSPKRKKNGARNVYYDFMKQVRPGDLIFSYAFAQVQGVGVATTHAYTSPRPDEFGHIGDLWDNVGWRVDVSFVRGEHIVRPKDHLAQLLPFMRDAHFPLRPTGDGMQHIYLTTISPAFARLILQLIGADTQLLGVHGHAAERDNIQNLFEVDLRGVDEWDEVETRKLIKADIPDTERTAIIASRRGQGRFKAGVIQLERMCRLTSVDNPTHLIASHMKPWRVASNEERLHAANGLMLTPNADHLFDRGFISFENNGDLLISPIADTISLERMGITRSAPRAFNTDQRHFLDYHRENIFLSA